MKIVGKMQPTIGKSILIGALAAASSARCLRSMRSCCDWTWSTLRDRHAKLLGLDDGADEVGDRLRIGSLGHVAEGIAPGSSHADLGQRLPELVDERPLHLLDHLGQGRVEPSPASTEMISRSRASGSWSTISSERFAMLLPSQYSGIT